jgi:hypothetical protein
MSKNLNKIALVAIAMSPLAFAAASAPAAAAPTLNFSIVVNQFSKPTMEFEYKGDKYVWKQQTINTQFSASANTNDNKLLWGGPLKIQTLGVGGSAYFTGNVPQDVKSWSLSGPIVFPTHFLSVYQAGFASYCEQNGVVGKPVVNQGLSILFSASQDYTEKLGVGEVPEEVQPGEPVGASTVKHASRTVNMPMAVSCGPKPARETPRPGGVVQETPDFKVKTIALNYGGVPGKTKPNAATECKQARLTVTFQTSKAGVVDFRLHKKIGNGPTQAKNLQVYAKFDGNAHFVASHQEIVSVKKTDLVQAMAEDRVNPIGLSTGWKDVTLRCEDIGGGFASTPGNANPDGLPSKQKQPKRTVGGPSQEAGANSTQAPFRPVIAPAKTTKTAPTGPARRFGIEREMKESGEKGGTEAPRATIRPPFFAQGTVLGIQR